MSNIKKLLINLICLTAILSFLIVILAILFAENEMELLKGILVVQFLGILGLSSLFALNRLK